MGKLTTLSTTGKTIIQKANLAKEFPVNSLLVHRPIAKGVRLPKLDVPAVNHGQYIYMYNNIRTNQVVYSLTRHLNVKPPFPLSPLHQSNALPEQRLPRPTPIPRQKNCPLSPPQRPMEPLLHGLLPNPPPRPLRLPQITRIPAPTRTLLPPRDHHREGGKT